MRESPVVLVVPYFTSSSDKRQAELEYCLGVNLSSQLFSRIFLLIDDDTKPPIGENIDVVRLQQRPTYAGWIEISRSFPNDTISILANSDIVFDTSVRFIQKCLEDEKSFVALSRHESINGELQPHPNPHWSQDCWAVRSPELVTDTLLHALHIPLGVPRCDNKVAYLFKVHGWTVTNPVGRVVTRHIHDSQERTYDKIKDTRVLGSVAYVHPSDPPYLESIIDFDIYCLNASSVGSVKVNRTLDVNLRKESSHPAPVSPLRKTSNTAIKSSREDEISPSSAPSTKSNPTGVRPDKPQKKKNPMHLRIWKEAQRFTKRRLRPSAKTRLEDASVVSFASSPASRPTYKGDLNYWQYPCLTEKHAFQTHEAIPRALCFDLNFRNVHLYIGAPWATLIDAGTFPPDLKAQLSENIDHVRELTTRSGHQLRLHTVCQHYAWASFLSCFEKLGITDLHLSHCVIGLRHSRINFHSWPLYAPNIENAYRSRGIRVALPLEEKPLLASFIGAHMPHYRSNVREILAEEARNDGGNDIHFQVSEEWHFNRTVYSEQKKGDVPSLARQLLELKHAEDYNKILSQSVFSLCPEGAGPNTLRLWESLAVGAIPVIVGSGDWIPPTLGKDEAALQKACLFVDRSETAGLFERLRSMDGSEIQRRQRAALECYQLARNKTAFDFTLPPEIAPVSRPR